MPDPIGNPGTQAALHGLLSGNFPGRGEFGQAGIPGMFQGFPAQGMNANMPDARAMAFLQAMGAGSPGPVLMGAARRLAAKNAPSQFVGSGADKEAQLAQATSGTSPFMVQMPQSGRPANF